MEKLKNYTPVATLTTLNNAALQGSVSPGEYVAVEVQAPTGLELDSTPQSFTVTTGQKVDVILRNAVNVTVKKVDEETNAPLEGAEIQITNCTKSGETKTVTTNSQGVANVALPAGCYDAKETKAPKGYKLNNTPVRTDITQQSTTITVADMKEEVKAAPRQVPNRVPVKKIPTGPIFADPSTMPEY